MSAGEARLHHDPTWYTPDALPAEFRAFDTPVEGLSAGSVTKLGLLDLAFAPSAGATRIVRQSLHGPLYILRPIYTDPGRPDMAFIYSLQMGDGLVQGDRYRIELDCAPGSAVHVTTQAATKLYRMDNNFATQVVNLRADDGAYVEYLPDPVIPFRDARFYQRIRLMVAPTASVILGEILLPGRVAYGEVHAYTLYYADTEVTGLDGTPFVVDRIKLAPTAASLRSPGRLGPYDVLATLYIVTRQAPARHLSDCLHRRLASQTSVLAGVSELPNECGVAVRMLGLSSLEVRTAFHLAWNEARLRLIGVPAPDLRKS
jgi:urease accessory protein